MRVASIWTNLPSALALLAVPLALPSVANAYSDPFYYTEPTETGGGGGRWFTGSSADGYGCEVCHQGKAGAALAISGVPLDGFVPGGGYEIAITWPPEEQHLALIAELTDELRQGAGTLTLPRPEAFKPAELCADEGLTGFPASEVHEVEPGRQLVSVIDCGARTVRFLWTAPALAQSPVWLNVGFVASDGDGAPSNDRVTMVRRPIPIAGQKLATRMVAKGGCGVVTARRERPAAWPMIAPLLVLALLALRRRKAAAWLAPTFCLLAGSSSARADELATAVYVRTDTDDTTVIAPRLRGQLELAETTKATLVYAVDVWTSASIDIMASASKRPVTEQRDELDVSIDHELSDLTFTGAYRYSVEPDYVSHGGSGGVGYDFADNNATLGIGVSGSTDTVGRAGDPKFSKPSGTLGGRLSFTQVLTKATLSQLIYELSRVSGYQVSPYRYVAIGGGRCSFDPGRQDLLSPLCVPENSPGVRLRHAIGFELRHALSGHVSLGGAYRFYLDDWALSSHTVRFEASYLPDADTILALRYRFYTQGAAEHYRATYTVPQPYVTSDKELSPLSSHRLALELDRVWKLDDGGAFTTTISVAPLYYAYRDFIPLKSMTGFELSAGILYAP